MMAEAVHFPEGTDREQQQMLTAIEHNCVCVYDKIGVRTFQCLAHAALVGNQRFVDDMLWGRHSAAQRVAEEFDDKPETP
jgi:hypothetical protein